MTPREFYSRFGRAITYLSDIRNGNPLTIPENPDRYLLVFWAVTDNSSIGPLAPGGLTTAMFSMTQTSAPIFLTHALYGAFVNSSFRAAGTGLGTLLRWSEGLIVDGLTGLPGEVPRKSKRKRMPRSTTQLGPEALLNTFPIFDPPELDVPHAPEPNRFGTRRK